MRGGTQLNGYDFAFLLRVEGFALPLHGASELLRQFHRFQLMYDKRSPRAITSIIAVIGIGSILYELAALLVVHVPDPVSVVKHRPGGACFHHDGCGRTREAHAQKAKRVTKVIKKR